MGGPLGSFLILSAGWGHVHGRATEICKADHGKFQAMLKYIEACDHESNRCKAQRKEDERCEQFLNEVNLRYYDDCQESPQPYPTVVLELVLHCSLLIRASPAVCR